MLSTSLHSVGQVTHTGTCQRVGVCVSEACRVLGVPMGQLEELPARHPQHVRCGFPDSVREIVSRIHVFDTFLALSAVLSAPPYPSVVLFISVFWMGQERSGPFGRLQHSWGSWAHTFMLSLSHPYGKNCWREGLLALSCVMLEE